MFQDPKILRTLKGLFLMESLLGAKLSKFLNKVCKGQCGEALYSHGAPLAQLILGFQPFLWSYHNSRVLPVISLMSGRALTHVSPLSWAKAIITNQSCHNLRSARVGSWRNLRNLERKQKRDEREAPHSISDLIERNVIERMQHWCSWIIPNLNLLTFIHIWVGRFVLCNQRWIEGHVFSWIREKRHKQHEQIDSSFLSCFIETPVVFKELRIIAARNGYSEIWLRLYYKLSPNTLMF